MARLNIGVARGGAKVKLFAPAYVPGAGIPAGATFVRALEASSIDNAGVVQYAAPGVMRESHYVGGVRTLLLEPSARNLCPYSSPADVTANHWQSSLMLAQAAVAGADGIAGSGKQVHQNTSNAVSFWYCVVAIAAGTYRLSSWLKNAVDGVRNRRHSLNDAVGQAPGPNHPSAAAWTRYSDVLTDASAITSVGYMGSTLGNELTIQHFGFQVELDIGVATSYIRNTTGATLIRPADDLSYPQPGTLYEKYYDDAGVLHESIRQYVAGTTLAPARPRAYVSLKLGLGNYSLGQMQAALV